MMCVQVLLALLQVYVILVQLVKNMYINDTKKKQTDCG